MTLQAGIHADSSTADVSFDVIKRSHALSGAVTDLDDFYHEWADSYDADVIDQGYTGPVVTTRLALGAAAEMDTPRSQISVLDAGCGTGLVGDELAKAGFSQVDGIDLSQAMVDRAQKVGVYRHLTGGVDLNHPVECLGTDSYDLLVCCGVFTVGHVQAQALDHLLEVVRRGGILVISTRLSHLKDSDFADHLGDLSTDGIVNVLRTDDNGPYIDEEGAKYWVLQPGSTGLTPVDRFSGNEEMPCDLR